jgi:UDP-sugar transporter A1/2/3
VLTQSLGGIIVAVCIKYADNILRTFSQTVARINPTPTPTPDPDPDPDPDPSQVAVIFGAFGSYFLFDFHITASFNVSLLPIIDCESLILLTRCLPLATHRVPPTSDS